jgi:hypothetical protein
MELVLTRDGNVASTRVGNLWLMATGSRPIQDETWRQYLEHSAASVVARGPFHGVLTWAPKHGPSTSQRRMLTGEFAEAIRLDAQRRVAVVSESAFARGTMTAINWLAKKNLAAFAPREIDLAFDWLEEDIEFDRVEAQDGLQQIIRAVDVPERKSGSSRG